MKTHRLLLLVMALSVGCSQLPSPNRSLADRVKNRGPLVLSDENPYLASNLFLAREMDRSKEVSGFIRKHGAPAAIAVEGDYFEAVKVRLFYPESRTSYTVEDVGDAHVITGPTPLSSEESRELAQVTRDIQGVPVLTTSVEPAGTTTARLPEGPEENSAPPEGVARRLEKAKHQLAGTGEEPADALSRPATDGPEAEISPKGDLVHYVTYPGETLSMIARWYTGDRANAGRIARINGLQNPDHVSIGDTVVVPKYLLSTTKRLTPRAIEALSATARSERRALDER